MAAILHIRGPKVDTSNTLRRLISKHVVLTMPPPHSPEGLALLIEEEPRPPTTSREDPIKVSRNITRAVQVAEALIPNINKMIIMGRLRLTTMRHMVRKKSSHTMGKPRLPPITPKAANTQQLTRQEQAETKPPMRIQPTRSLRPIMVAIVGNIKRARATLNVPKPLMQTPTNNVVMLNTPLAAKIKDATGKVVHQGVPLMIRAELRKNAQKAIKNLVPATHLGAMGIGTKAQMYQ